MGRSSGLVMNSESWFVRLFSGMDASTGGMTCEEDEKLRSMPQGQLCDGKGSNDTTRGHVRNRDTRHRMKDE
jgi:hypothetical protein